MDPQGLVELGEARAREDPDPFTDPFDVGGHRHDGHHAAAEAARRGVGASLPTMMPGRRLFVSTP